MDNKKMNKANCRLIAFYAPQYHPYQEMTNGGGRVLLATSISFTIGVMRVRSTLHIKPIALFETIRPALLCSLVMAAIVLIVKHLVIVKELNHSFLIYGFLAAIVYVVATFLMNRNILRDIKEILV
jgi:hypothetical protein